MRISLILSLGLAVLTVVASAQENHHAYRVKPSHLNEKKSAATVPTPKTLTPSNSASMDLRKVERQTAKVSGTTPVARPNQNAARADLLKTEKQKPVPPINFTGANGGGVNRVGTTTQGKNPYKGRLRQKGAHH